MTDMIDLLYIIYIRFITDVLNITSMSNQITQYKKKCTRNQNEILTCNTLGKWKAMETEANNVHKCVATAVKISAMKQEGQIIDLQHL